MVGHMAQPPRWRADLNNKGPWWFIPQSVDAYVVNLLPSVAHTSLAVNSSACSSQTANCPLPMGTLWAPSGGFAVTDGEGTASNRIDPGAWAPDATALLGLSGSGQYITDRLTLYFEGNLNQPAFLDMHGMMLSDSYEATFPGGASYTLDTGFVSVANLWLLHCTRRSTDKLKLSLYGGEQTVNWTMTNGSSLTTNRTLPDAYTAGFVPSISYGMHIGSVSLP